MRSRMDRYRDEVVEDKKIYSRTNRNSELYTDVGSNQKYTTFTDVTHTNAIDIQDARANYHTREGYHKMKEYDSLMPAPKVKRELDEFNYLYQDHENKIYDINTVLEEARKKRGINEQAKKLKNTNYDILAGLNPKALEEYRERKNQSKRPVEDEEEIKELINTISSNTLAGQVKNAEENLFKDLMATNLMDKVGPSSDMTDYVSKQQKDIDNSKTSIDLSISREILDKDSLEKVKNIAESDTSQNTGIMSSADNDFYTRSMDLSDKDFELDDEFSEKRMPFILKLLIFLVFILLLVGIGYFIYKNYL